MATNTTVLSADVQENMIAFLEYSMTFLGRTLDARLQQYFGKEDDFEQPGFEFVSDGSPLSKYLRERGLGIEEYLILLLALYPHISPHLIDVLVKQYLPKGGDFPAIGGVRGTNARTIMPTLETALFILAGNNLSHRLRLLQWLKSAELTILKEGVVKIEDASTQEPDTAGVLQINPEYLHTFVYGQAWQPKFSQSFPASLLKTDMSWEDLVLPQRTLSDIQLIKSWLDHQNQLRNDTQLGKRIKPGYRALFYGKPGTGKTLAATLLGKLCQKAVYRIDLSMVVSKYIGETEKNLRVVFDTAAHKNWILFFDEADALFSKRMSVKSSNDRFANQEVSFLLQKVEEHDGLVILASNFKNNLDPAFMRRFQSIIQFPLPDRDARLRLWENTIPGQIALEEEAQLEELARKYELTGSSILNVVHRASILALSNQRPIGQGDLLDGIREEYAKVGKSI